jgi:hypothetical protein
MANQVYPLSPGDTGEMLFVATQSGAIQRQDHGGEPIRRGLVIIDSPSAALALTIAAPLPGPQISGGHDGCVLQIIVGASGSEPDGSLPAGETAVHTVTFPSGAINGGTFTTASFVPQVGTSLSLIAYNGYFFKFIGSAVLT